MRTFTLVVTVRDQHIQHAIKNDSHHCMIADAVREAYPRAKYIMVDLQSVRFSDLESGYRYIFLTPPAAQVALLRFDKGKKVQPFKLRLVSGMTRPVGWRTNHPNTEDRTGKKYKRTGKKREYRLSREREFGLRKFTDVELLNRDS